MSWRPILTGAAAGAARRVVEEVLAALAEQPLLEGGPGLADGAAGKALLFAYAARSGGFPEAEETAEALLAAAAQALSDQPMGPDLFAGFPGVGWALAHVGRMSAGGGAAVEGAGATAHGGEAEGGRDHDDEHHDGAGEDGGDDDDHDGSGEGGDDDDELVELDEALADFVSHRPWSGDWDLVSGLVGHGVYALERLPHAAARRALAEIVGRLEEGARKHPDGNAWWTRPESLPPWQRKAFPRGYYNFGVAHGVPGIAWLLARAANEPGLEHARPFAHGAVSWLLARRIAGSVGRSLPANLAGEGGAPARSAWCYGDPGASVCLLDAARRLGDSALEGEVLGMARAAATLPFAQTQVRDPGLCHGAAGLAHLNNRLFHATGEEVFRTTALAHLTRAIGMRRRDQPVAGFWSEQTGEGAKPAARALPDATFLTGATGVGLTLLAAISELEPAWDGVLLASVAPKT